MPIAKLRLFLSESAYSYFYIKCKMIIYKNIFILWLYSWETVLTWINAKYPNHQMFLHCVTILIKNRTKIQSRICIFQICLLQHRTDLRGICIWCYRSELAKVSCLIELIGLGQIRNWTYDLMVPTKCGFRICWKWNENSLQLWQCSALCALN